MNVKNLAILGILIGLSTHAFTEEITLDSKDVKPAALDRSSSNEVSMSIIRAQDWLLKTQNEDGSWSRGQWPSLTGLPVWALSLSENRTPEVQTAIDKGVAFLKSKAKDDGSIYDEQGGLRNYNTALSMLGLFMSKDTDSIPYVQRARKYIAGSQYKGDGPYKGGMGYDGDLSRNYADMSNSFIAYEAMALTEAVEDLRSSKEERADLDWDAAVDFLMQNQNLDNDKPWMHDDGGFVYHPQYFDTKGRISNKAGAFTNETNIIKFRSYGSMTYAGLLSFLYADVSPDDYRVRSAFKWAMNNWSLDENPGMGDKGLYYFYNVLAKGLRVMGYETITLADGRKVSWRQEFVDKVLSLKQLEDDGTAYWVNEKDKYNESDKTMVTSFMIIALRYANN